MGTYRVNSNAIQTVYRRIKREIKNFTVTLKHILREYNSDAGSLAQTFLK